MHYLEASIRSPFLYEKKQTLTMFSTSSLNFCAKFLVLLESHIVHKNIQLRFAMMT